MRIQVLYTADLKFYAKAVLLTSIIAVSPFPVSQWIARPLPYTVTASLRIPTGFPFHLLLSRHLCATTLYFFQTVGLYHILSNCQSVLMVGLSKIWCGIFSFRAVRRKAVAVKFYMGFRNRRKFSSLKSAVFLSRCGVFQKAGQMPRKNALLPARSCVKWRRTTLWPVTV